MNAPGDNTIHTEDQDAGVCVAGSILSSSKQPIFALQGNEVTKSNKFNSSSGCDYFAPVAVSAHMTTANILTQANLSTLRPAEAPMDLNLRKVSHSANYISLGNNNHNHSTAATIIDDDNANCAADNTYDTAHDARSRCTVDLVIRKNSASRTSIGAGVRYRECLKNHAANMGGYAVDGCGEFMWSGEESSLEALKCAACGCHRNFHRREVNGESSTTAAVSSSMGLLALAMNPSSTNASNSGYGQLDHKNNKSSALSGNGGGQLLSSHCSGGHSGPMLTHPHQHRYIHAWLQGDNKLVAGAGARAGQHTGPSGRHLYVGGLPCHGAGGISGHCRLGGAHVKGTGKRFRTKFTMEQREKLLAFSEKVGWRIHKGDEAAVQQFCSEIGVKRHVLKVWMHNNKKTFRKNWFAFQKP